MSFGKFRFKDFKEYKAISELAVQNGFTSIQRFDDFLEAGYQHLKKTTAEV